MREGHCRAVDGGVWSGGEPGALQVVVGRLAVEADDRVGHHLSVGLDDVPSPCADVVMDGLAGRVVGIPLVPPLAHHVEGCFVNDLPGPGFVGRRGEAHLWRGEEACSGHCLILFLSCFYLVFILFLSCCVLLFSLLNNPAVVFSDMHAAMMLFVLRVPVAKLYKMSENNVAG